MLGDHADADLSGELVDKVVQDEAAEVGGQGADDHGLEVVGEIGACDGHHSGDNDGLSEIHVEVLVHDLRDNVETAGRGVGVKEDCLSVAITTIIPTTSRAIFPVGEPGFGNRISNTKRSAGSRTEIKMILCPEGLIHEEEARMMQMMFKSSIMADRDSGTKFTRTTASPEILPLMIWFGFMKK